MLRLSMQSTGHAGAILSASHLAADRIPDTETSSLQDFPVDAGATIRPQHLAKAGVDLVHATAWLGFTMDLQQKISDMQPATDQRDQRISVEKDVGPPNVPRQFRLQFSANPTPIADGEERDPSLAARPVVTLEAASNGSDRRRDPYHGLTVGRTDRDVKNLGFPDGRGSHRGGQGMWWASPSSIGASVPS